MKNIFTNKKPLLRRYTIIALGVFAALVMTVAYIPPVRALAYWPIRRINMLVKGEFKDDTQARKRLEAASGKTLTFPLPGARIVVCKAPRRLKLFSGNDLIKTYQIGLGRASSGAKTVQGDRRTPAGEYYICTRLSKSSFYVFMGLSYPNARDAAGALKNGTITQAEHDAIATAIKARRQPPWDTKMGGAIGIHGGGSDSDWTLGCIAVSNDSIEELWTATQMGTVVEIYEEKPPPPPEAKEIPALKKFKFAPVSKSKAEPTPKPEPKTTVKPKPKKDTSAPK